VTIVQAQHRSSQAAQVLDIIRNYLSEESLTSKDLIKANLDRVYYEHNASSGTMVKAPS